MRRADTTPMLVPALKIPVANALSFFGNHSDTVFMAAGKFPASPNPRPTRATPKPKALRAMACSIPAMLHMTIVIAKPIFVPILSMSQPKKSNPAAYAAVKAMTMYPKSVSDQLNSFSSSGLSKPIICLSM